jgi:hypothetical protein
LESTRATCVFTVVPETTSRSAISALDAAGDQPEDFVAQMDLNKIKSNPALLASGAGFAEFAKLAHPYGPTACAPNN